MLCHHSIFVYGKRKQMGEAKTISIVMSIPFVYIIVLVSGNLALINTIHASPFQLFLVLSNDKIIDISYTTKISNQHYYDIRFMVIISPSILSIPRLLHSDYNKQTTIFFLTIVTHLIFTSQTLCSPQCIACSLNNCTSCLPGYYPQKQLCLTCKSGCQICIGSNNCQNCSQGYKYDDQVGQCYSQNCLSIGYCSKCVEQACINCWADYNLQNGSCVKKQIANQLSALGVILSITISLATVIILICCIVACARKTSQETELAEGIETGVNINRSPLKPHINQRKTIKISPRQWLILIQIYNPSETCCICLDSETQISTSCCHYFHESCLYDWSIKQAQCPYCRTKQIFPIRFICCRCRETYFETGRSEVEIRPPILRYCPKCSYI